MAAAAVYRLQSHKASYVPYNHAEVSDSRYSSSHHLSVSKSNLTNDYHQSDRYSVYSDGVSAMKKTYVKDLNNNGSVHGSVDDVTDSPDKGRGFLVNGHDDSFSTINSPTSMPGRSMYSLVRKSDFNTPRVDAPAPQQLKVDTYNVGVILDTKMTGVVFDPDKFKMEAVAPTGRIVRLAGGGNYNAPFNKDEIGVWKVSMFYEGRYLDGCDLDVCDPSQVKVKELQGGHVGRENTFFIDCTRAGQGELGVDISHHGQPVPATVHPTSSSGYHQVNWVPRTSGPHEINVHFNRAEIRESDFHTFESEERQRKVMFDTRVDPQEGFVDVKASCDWEVDYLTGGPFVCHVSDVTDIAVYGMEDGTVCAHPTLITDCTRVGEGHVDADVTYRGKRYRCNVKPDKPCTYKVSFRPRGPGVYKVWINYNNQPVRGSPFIQEIEELQQPTASGDGLYRGVLGQQATFTVDTRGFPGQVAVGIDGPTRPVPGSIDQTGNNIKVTYTPTERGPHRVHIKLDGNDIEGSPYGPLIIDTVGVKVSGDWRTHLDQKGVIPLRVNKPKTLSFDVTGAGPGELTSMVEGPGGKIPVSIDAQPDGKQSVIFTPREEGKHNIHVKWGDYPLEKSPYLGFATHEPELDPNQQSMHLVWDHNIRSGASSVANGPPEEISLPPAPSSPAILTTGEVNSHSVHEESTKITTNHTEAKEIIGAVQVLPVAAVPVVREEMQMSSAKTTSTSRKQTYNVTSSTKHEHTTAATFNKIQQDSTDGPQKVVLSGKGLKEAEVNKESVFFIDGTQANKGTASSHLEDIHGASLAVAADLVKTQTYKCTYTPKRAGSYLLYVDWNGKSLKGSPFKVDVKDLEGEKKMAAARKVKTVWTKSTYTRGTAVSLQILQQDAGSGPLTVDVTGPGGEAVPYQLADNLDGTKSLSFTPAKAGKYRVDIKYDGYSIKGSPYYIEIKESVTTGEVHVWGPGTQSGTLSTFDGSFDVDFSKAGSGDLKIRVNGPKGAFKVGMEPEEGNPRVYKCFYDPRESGIYTVNVQWSGRHVNKSPFTVVLADTAEELQLMQANLHSDRLSHISTNGGVVVQRSDAIHSRFSSKFGPHRHHYPSGRSHHAASEILW